MPVIPGDMGIKSWSYEIVVVSDGVDSWELCEDCAREDGFNPESDDVIPVFASTECDRNPTCDNCNYATFIFSPTAECINDWTDMLYQYCLTGYGNVEYLDRVAENMTWIWGDEVDDATVELYRVIRSIPTMFRRK